MWTVSVAPAARVIGWPASVSVWLPLAPASVKAAGLPGAGSLTQVTPVPEPTGQRIGQGDAGRAAGAAVVDGDREADAGRPR